MAQSPFQPLTPQNRSNFHHLYSDIAWFGVVMGSILSFIGVYVARLGATSFQVGLLSAGPAVVNLLVTLPAARWLEGRPLAWSAFWSSVWQRSGYLLFIPLPVLISSSAQIWGMVLITLCMSVPGTYLPIAFNALFAEIVPPNWMAYVVGRRNALVAIGLLITVLICGQLLDWIESPINYQIVFAIGAIGALLSSYHVGKLRSNVETIPPVERSLNELLVSGFLHFGKDFSGMFFRLKTRSGDKPLIRLDLLRGPFGLFMGSYVLFYTFQFALFPLLPIYLVRDLNLTDGAVSLGSALIQLMTMLVSFRLGQISVRLGNRRMLVIGGLLFGLYPLVLFLAHGEALYLVASFVGGIIWALLGGGLLNRLMERTPPDDRPAHMALHNLALNLGILAGSLLGPALSDWFGLREAILLTAILRLLGGILLWVWG